MVFCFVFLSTFFKGLLANGDRVPEIEGGGRFWVGFSPILAFLGSKAKIMSELKWLVIPLGWLPWIQNSILGFVWYDWLHDFFYIFCKTRFVLFAPNELIKS